MLFINILIILIRKGKSTLNILFMIMQHFHPDAKSKLEEWRNDNILLLFLFRKTQLFHYTDAMVAQQY